MVYHELANFLRVYNKKIGFCRASYPPARHRENRFRTDTISRGRADPSRQCLLIAPRLSRPFHIAAVWKIERFPIENYFEPGLAFDHGFSFRFRLDDEQPRRSDQNMVEVKFVERHIVKHVKPSAINKFNSSAT